MAESDTAFGQVVGGKLHGHTVARQNANAVAAEAPGQMSQHYAVVFQLHAEQAAGKFFQNNSGYFNIVFFTHSVLFWVCLETGKPAGRRGRPVCHGYQSGGLCSDRYVCRLQTFRATRDFKFDS